ncbi:MAG: hypothetical protein VYA80_07600 [Pseudomonadota bacterium]|nr:hypothetical protein [Pseudomonadota bacterium]
MPTAKVKITFILTFFACPVIAQLPLQIGNTDILDPGDSEIIVAYIDDDRQSNDSYILPYAEISYGLTNNTQTTLSLSRAGNKPFKSKHKSDFGPINVEYLYRFFDNEQISIATGPNYSFPLNKSSQRRAITSPTRLLNIPLVATYSSEQGWYITGEASYTFTSSSSNALGYALASGYQFSNALTLLAEINGSQSIDSYNEDREINWRFGGIYEVSNDYSLLFGIGGNLESELIDVDQLHREIFLGIQFN